MAIKLDVEASKTKVDNEQVVQEAVEEEVISLMVMLVSTWCGSGH